MARVFALGDKMEIKEIALSELKPYDKNPRKNDNAVDYVLKSIQRYGFKGPLVVDKNNVIVCGHTRFKAAQKLGFKSLPCIVAADLSDEKIKEFRLVDNKTAEFAEWDDAFLIEELHDLEAFNTDISDFGFDISAVGALRKSWARTEKYCDLKRKFEQHPCGDAIVTSFYKVGKRGIPITEIKTKPSNAELFADNLCDYLLKMAGNNFSKGHWCLLTTPRRRHKEGFHFSTAICELASTKIGLPFYKDAFTAENRDRINPEFHMEINPAEPNVILYDDIISTGETIRTCQRMLLDEGHVVICLVGIKNQTV